MDRHWPPPFGPRPQQPSRSTSRTGGRRFSGLAAVLVGENPASESLRPQQAARPAKTRAWRAGRTACPPTATQQQLLELVDQLNGDPAVSGILVQLPLPKQMDEAAIILSRVAPRKDVDCFHPENVGLLAAGHPRFLPCTPFGVFSKCFPRATAS